MARREADREDLMREATALRQRIELQIPGEPEPVVAGFRDDGRLSLYFGPDPAYHFDAAGRLRRAYCDGHLYRSQGNTLARLVRERSAAETTLRRSDLRPDELGRFLDALHVCITNLAAAVQAGTTVVLRQEPVESDVGPRLAAARQIMLARGQRLSPRIKR